MTYNKILVPYDSSKLSDTALEHAIKIAKMSISYPADNIVNVILFYVTPVITYSVYYWNYLIKIRENRRNYCIEPIYKRTTS